MKKSLAMFALFGIVMFISSCIIMPFWNPWFFLMGIPMIAMLPHMDSIADWIFSTLDEGHVRGVPKARNPLPPPPKRKSV